jgi:MFS family permease
MPKNWTLVALLMAIQALSFGIIVFSFSLWVDPLATEFGVDRKSILAILSVFGVASCLVPAVASRYLDSAAPRILLLIGVAALGGGLVLLAAAPTLWSIYLIFIFFFPLSMIFAGPLVAITLITRAFEKGRGLAIGLALQGGAVGGAIVPNIFAALLADHGWREATLYFGLFALLLLVPLVLVVVRPGGAVPRQAAGPGALTVKDVFRRSEFWLSIATILLFLGIFSAVQPNIAPFAADLRLSVRSAGLLITIFALSVVPGGVIAGYLSDKMDLRVLWVGVALAELIGLGLFTNAPGTPRLYVGLALIGATAGALSPLQAALFTRVFGAAVVGRIMGLATPFFAIGSATASLAAWARERMGSYDPVFYAAMIAACATVPLIMMLGPSRRQARVTTA